ncbi:cellulose biosynthesis cyclic di-GMP-binding regulatory protein BcsB [Curvibacter sp. APW13]|uniref:cellulose biosynthesis cyclic di-GMP-binding regulatory protein BcsB n=1 Tax=Curvibacter sp. APW13 TaxID=3077236 RepID=UPI0028E01D09|nr:cellulose biosynthesis cyclic di-GMP-binding regulatory protein BcsB [Curvibacter sp. APW13]MDT8990053.1 cellulose biosynthesis cyclic di-GMP-binding regulatory protein BcsB [Curvibacter sp. APW13]
MAKFSGFPSLSKPLWWTALMAVSMLLAPADLAFAKSRKNKDAALMEEPRGTEAPTGASRTRTVSLSFKQLGAWSSIKLRGVDGSQALFFPVRPDEVVIGAKLRIAYDYSPALIPELSHLKVLLNDRVAAVEGLPKDKNVGNARDINLDPRLFKEMNALEFKLIGHYTRQCEDPYHSSLWLTLSDLGRLELTLAPVSMASDLKNLPAPFFDRRESSPLSVPFVFTKGVNHGTIQAAGVVASWFGLQARNKSVQFPVTLNELPDGNAVVFLQGGENIQGVKGTAAASVALIPHPNNPLARLLVISGANPADIAKAAHAVALASHTLAGQLVSVTNEVEAAPRKPYDAPAWIPTDRPVRMGELMRADQMRVHAYYPDPIRLNYRVSPDVFTWRSEGVPVDLKFRVTRLPFHRNSSLNVGLNNNYLQSFSINDPVQKVGDTDKPVMGAFNGSGIRQEQMYLPPYASDGRDQLQFAYYFDVVKEGECRSLPPANLEAAIDPESTIDFSGFPKFAALPNLAYFANLGFPFTRLADLSDTAFAMPDNPGAEELSLYLTVLGRMGESTGYPALRHGVVSHLDIEKASAKDIVVVGSGNSQSLISKWKDALPMVMVDGDRRVREYRASWRAGYRWAQEDITTKPNPAGALQISGNASLSTIMGFESPLQSGKSVVFLYADKPSDLRKISDALTDNDRLASIQGDFVVVDDKSISHVKASDTYYVGSLPWLSKVRWFFADQPFVLAGLVTLAAILLGALLYRPLKHLAAQRGKKHAVR